MSTHGTGQTTATTSTIPTTTTGSTQATGTTVATGTAQATTPAEFATKTARVRALLASRGERSLSLSTRESLAWLLCGARVTVPTNGDPVLSVVVDEDSVTVHALANETDRIVAEELAGIDGFTLVEHPWFEPLPGSQARPAATLAEHSVAAELRAMRATLLPVELARYRALGADVAAAVTRVAGAARPSDTERQLASAIVREVVAVGAEPIVTLVAGHDRLGLRHPLPTGGRVGQRLMLVAGARRDGLIVNLTRWVGDERGSAESDARLLRVEADAFAATTPGRPLSAVLDDVAASYAAHGFAADEWMRHHQGGPTGYAGRDPRATPAVTDLVHDGQAFAWNPSVPRGKVEDTVVIAGGITEVLTADPAWPVTVVAGRARPLALPFA